MQRFVVTFVVGLESRQIGIVEEFAQGRCVRVAAVLGDHQRLAVPSCGRPLFWPGERHGANGTQGPLTIACPGNHVRHGPTRLHPDKQAWLVRIEDTIMLLLGLETVDEFLSQLGFHVRASRKHSISYAFNTQPHLSPILYLLCPVSAGLYLAPLRGILAVRTGPGTPHNRSCPSGRNVRKPRSDLSDGAFLCPGG